MRRLLKAALLLAPALATAFEVPTGVEDIKDAEGARIADHSFALIGVEIPSPSYDWTAVFALRLDVLPSEEACGFGNVTVDGHALPQTLKHEVASGKGSITTERQNIVIASWSFHCVKVNGQPDSQLMKFVIDFLDGKPTKGAGFSALFRQTGSTEIVNIETDLSLPDEVAANPNPEGLQPVGHEFPHFSIEQEMDELRWLRAQMKELEYLIEAKEQAIAERASTYFEEDIRDCDNLKCVARAVIDKARKAAHHVINKIHGHVPNGDHGIEEEDFGHFPKPKLPHGWPKHGKHGNHTCKHPKHGNHTSPPHWRRPHYRPLPICRFPPPPRKGGPPGKPPHPRPPPGETPPPPKHGDFPPSPPSPPGGFQEDSDVPPTHRQPKDFLQNGPPHDESEVSFHLFDDEFGRPGPAGRHPHFGGPGHHHIGLSKVFHIFKFAIVGCFVLLLLIAIHRRGCTSQRRADRQARCKERHRRRAFRRAARKYMISRFLARISGHESASDSEDSEEKRQALLASAEDGLSTTMTEEITEFRNAAEVIDDIVAASSRQSRTQSIPIVAPVSENHPLIRDYDIGSQVGDGEELPAYEDNDESGMSSVVADGFRYTPGSTDYSPSQSLAGSVSDILGPDTKQ